MNGVLGAWLAEIIIISIRDFADPAIRRPPLPSELLSTFVVFGALSAVAGTETGRRPAQATAWGIVIATILSAKVDFLKPVGDFFAPSPGAKVALQTGQVQQAPPGPAFKNPGPANIQTQIA